jgi:phage-related protein
MLSNSYTQPLSTGVNNLLESPIATLKVATYLTSWIRYFRMKRAAEADCSQRRKYLMGKVYVIAALLSITSISNASANEYSIDHLKLYAHSRIVNYKQFQCFNVIITKESRWNYKAHNGSHWGLGQMKSNHYRNLDPYRQIDATLKYVANRYGDSCKALLHHQKHNWF